MIPRVSIFFSIIPIYVLCTSSGITGALLGVPVFGRRVEPKPCTPHDEGCQCNTIVCALFLVNRVSATGSRVGILGRTCTPLAFEGILRHFNDLKIHTWQAGSQHSGPFLGPHYGTAPNVQRNYPQTGTIILRAHYMYTYQ